ncbi:hypothetical protein C8R48DRAFT_592463, partial [Suillus tomentosus]
PHIPRRDQPKVYPRYCQLMLILLRLWHVSKDLQSQSQSWEEAFTEFCANIDSQSLQVMNNMQMLHECCDSQDNNFENRLACMWRSSH